MPHKILNLKYEVKANQTLDDASEIEINLCSVDADGVGFKIEGNHFSLSGLKNVPDDFESKDFSLTFDQSIETPGMVLKKYKEMKN